MMQQAAQYQPVQYKPAHDDINWQLLVQVGSEFYKEKEVSDECWTAMAQCSNQTMTTGRCKSTFQGFLLDWVRNDVDVNCQVDAKDFVPDINHFFDISPRDGQTCTNEWSDRRTQYNGYTREYTDFEMTVITGGRDRCIATDTLDQFPAQVLRTEFSNSGVSRLVSFCNSGNNMYTNRDCLGLPVICRDRRPDLPACQQLPSDVRSLKQKIDQNQRMNDPNGDGRATVDEVAGDISTHYDVNNDGCATEAEWIARWTSFYGFTEEFARAFYAGVNNGDNCANRADVERNLGVDGEDSSFFPNTLIAIIVGFCEATPSLYETNKDCAMVVDTCLGYFRQNQACQVYVDQCGAAKYKSCVSVVSNSQCVSDVDRAEVHREIHRVDNLVNKDCKDPREACRFKEKIFGLFGM